MGKPQTPRRVVLDRQYLIAIVGDREFYAACPAFAWMRDTVLQAYKRYRSAKPKQSCCSGDWAILRPVIDGWFTALRAMHAQDPASVEPVRDFVSRKKGYICKPLVVYYRASREGRPAKFQF